MTIRMHAVSAAARPRPVPALRLAALGAVLTACQVFGVGCSRQVSDRDLKPIALADAARLHARSQSQPLEALFIDPRPAVSYEHRHIAGARNLVLTADDQDRGTDPAIDRYATLIVYGDNPGSAVARAMAKRMMAAGYSRKKVKLLEEGLNGWERAGLPVGGTGSD